ncbi:hypothetical protein [Clostridium tagluense]|uniref:Uncharacterized protein n=1 Tax=Clostridium tagluense TaxID=360422 RepID=A0A401UQB0_9CLOT|nr:hypothetical protein [Clostridium tagluense]GCD11742.1 hypothetical protein Ctaglu_33650 [Clostridium tagluense]
MLTNVSCENCRHQNICKYSEKLIQVTATVNEIGMDFELHSPIKLIITCHRFEKKPQKQDGFYPR